MEAHYLAAAVSTVLYTLSPHRIILGGGVMQQAALFPMIRGNVMRMLNGYVNKPQLNKAIDHYIILSRLSWAVIRVCWEPFSLRGERSGHRLTMNSPYGSNQLVWT
jgi:hypothetical protein